MFCRDVEQGGIAVANDESVAARLAGVHARAPVQDEQTIANRLQNLSLNYAMNKDPQRWWRGEITWLQHGKEYFYGIPAAEVAGQPPSDARCRMSAPGMSC